MNAVVFAYHSVGTRCLRALLARGIHVDLLVTHDDDPEETIWFENVAKVAEEAGIPIIRPKNANDLELFNQLNNIQPDFIFSFYYRLMLPESILKTAKKGAFNMHGSLLPKYRGRVPINWAVLHGEIETGATLHEMTIKPDAGAILAQESVPILPEDTAYQVFEKVVVIAEKIIWETVPKILENTVIRKENKLNEGSYFGRRCAEDGRINWQENHEKIHNLIRAVAPPYPGAFTEKEGKKWIISKSKKILRDHPINQILNLKTPGIYQYEERYFGVCGDQRLLELFLVD